MILLKTDWMERSYRRGGATHWAMCLAIAAMLWVQPARARVTRVVVDASRSESPTLDGKEYGKGIRYERIAGEVYGELDPKDPRNALIQDIELAPRNDRGRVEYVATFTLVKPVDMSKSSGVLIYEVVNRGSSIVPRRYEAGDVFLVSGWQGDIAFHGQTVYGRPAETIRVPVAKNPDGSAITGPVLARFSNMSPGLSTLPMRAATGYASSGDAPMPADLDTTHASLTTRTYESVTGAASAATAIASSDWAWADCTSTPFPGKPDPKMICLRNGFDPRLLYQLSYQGKDPLVLGIGLAATRDINAFFRHAAKDDAGWLNPLAGHIEHAIGVGASQSGNLIRTFLNLGFNEDESGKMVWDGAMPTIAARQTPLNVRFAVPGGASNPYEVGSDGVVWWGDWPDTVRDHPTSGLLHRCNATHTCPKIVEVLGSSEFWSLRASPDFVGTGNDKDIPLPANVRRYYVASTQHGGGPGGFRREPVAPPARAQGNTNNPLQPVPCVMPPNPNPEDEIRQAMLVALKEWVVRGIDPPESNYPTLAAGTLVPATSQAMGFPMIPGVPAPDGVANPLIVYDFGADFHYNDLSGVITKEPPAIRTVIEPLVPRVDGDGNEVGGIHTVLQQAALGTYLGWNVAATGFAKGQYCSLTGSYVPFAATRAERAAAYDPRPSLEERYGTQEGYVCAVRKAAKELAHERFLLPEDAERLIAEAGSSKILPGDTASDANAKRVAGSLCAQVGAR
jgi:hypothetical protein